MSVMKAPKIPPLLLALFKTAPFLARKLVATYLGKRPPAWQQPFEQATAAALTATGMHTAERVKTIGRLPHKFIADVMFLRNAPLDAIKRLPVEVHGHYYTEPKSETGTLYACANLGAFYMSFLRPPVGVKEILVVTPTVPPEEDRRLCQRIEEVTGVKLVLTEASTRSAIAIARHLKKGGAVATMLDSYIPGTPFIAAPFMGQAAATPRGIYDIVSRLSARIIPVYNFRTDKGFDVHYQKPITTDGRDPESLASEVNMRLGQVIRDNPEQWSMWAALPGRWHTAAQPLAQTALAA